MNQNLIKGCVGKARFHTQAKAEQVAAKRSNELGITLRVYWCGICSHWHLTRRALPRHVTVETRQL